MADLRGLPLGVEVPERGVTSCCSPVGLPVEVEARGSGVSPAPFGVEVIRVPGEVAGREPVVHQFVDGHVELEWPDDARGLPRPSWVPVSGELLEALVVGRG